MRCWPWTTRSCAIIAERQRLYFIYQTSAAMPAVLAPAEETILTRLLPELVRLA